MRFMRAEDGTAFSVDQIVSVGAANTIRGSKGFGHYLMVTLPDGRIVVPINPATRAVWPAAELDAFLNEVEAYSHDLVEQVHE